MSLWDAPKVYLLHRGAIEATGYLMPWARFNGQTQDDSNWLVIPGMEPGDYAACLIHPGERNALLAGAVRDTACSSGSLAASGELILSPADVR